MTTSTPVLQRSETEREGIAERIADHLDGPMTALGVIFLLLVFAETVLEPTPAIRTAFSIASWVIWAMFVAEFVVRLVVAPSRTRFLRRNWWQLIFLALPFLRFLRLLARLRLRVLLRGGKVLSSAVRGTRTAARALTGRVAWLLAVTLIVVLSASQLLYVTGAFDVYVDALHGTAVATITGQPLGKDHWLARVADVVLGAYSVVVFATLAGVLGAYFVEERGSQSDSGREKG